MLRNARSICLDVFDYNSEIVCKLFDSTADISGQATNVFVRKERNGWKELSFKLPSTCTTEEGIEDNYRLNCLVSDYKIRVTEHKDDGREIIDWFIISENKITHSINGKTVDVIAGHISQLLKTKNLGLEFSDQEGNNVGTCEELLTTILEGTGWTVGNVAEFKEDDGLTIKVRSLSAEMRTGAFRLITDMCDKFEARPVFNGDYSVDIKPVNPFSEVEEGEIPQPVLNDEVEVIELSYNKNVHDLTRTLNTDNMVTRLYAYGSYGDMNGICGLSTCKHVEIVYKNTSAIENGREVVFTDTDDIRHYFIANATTANTQFAYSLLDFLSESYIWDGSYAYELYTNPKQNTQIELTRVEVKSIQNYFDYLMDFDYYHKVGLFKDEHLQRAAKFQREMPAIIKSGMDASSALTEKEEELSKVAESNSGFLRLDVAHYDSGNNGELKLVLDKRTYADGVIYRSDYDEARRNYFSWYVATQLKEDGDPVTDIGSLVYIIHNTTPISYERAYLKEINGQAQSYYYDDRDTEEPNNITLWISRAKVPSFSSGDQFFLFCSNSISGQLGVRESELESLEKTLQQSTKLVTELHPTYFVWDDEEAHSTSDVLKTYGWMYRSYSNASTLGQLYFCYGEMGETTWHPVTVSVTAPSVTNGNYYYNIKERKVYHGEGSQWVWEDDTDTKRLSNNFTKVVTACKKRDMLYKGVYEKYEHTPSGVLNAANYIFKNEYDYYWAFSTDKQIASGHKIWMDTEQNLIYQDDSVETVVKPELKAFDALTYPASNEFSETTFALGIINRATGVEENSETFYRTNNINVYGNVEYKYNVPNNSYIVFYDSKKRFLEDFSLNATGTFTTQDRARYARVIVPQVKDANYLQVNNYSQYVFISDKQYKILAFTGKGNKLGMHYLLAAMRDKSNDAYLNYLPAYQAAMKTIKDKDSELTSYLGDMYREGYWQKNEYVEGDEDKLYKDSRDALVKIAKPEASYSFTFLDLYKANLGVGYSVDELDDVDWPDIDENFAVHLIDSDIDVNCWAAVEIVNKCYDQRWMTQLEITTELSTIRQHSFTDALAYIADVANATKMNQTIYQRAANLSGAGKLAASKLEGAIEAAKTSILGGSSNWYTDPKTGGIVLVSADNSSAMMLTGAGWLIANTKDRYGDFEWRSAGTGAGLTADVITAGEMSAERLLAGTITTDKVVASFGQELEIGSNKALTLYATADGYRPAGGLKTQVATGDGRFRPVEETDSYIEIAAKNGQTPAYVNIMTGGELNLQGSTMNLAAKSNMHLLAGTYLDIRSDSDIEINAASKLNIMAGSDLTIHSPHFNVYQDANGDYRVDVDGVVYAKAGKIAGFNIGAIYKDGMPHDPEKDAYVQHRYIYSGTDSIDSISAGIYMGTNGVNIGGKLKYIVNGTKSYLTAEAEEVVVGKQSTDTKGTFMSMNAKTGTIELVATSAINIKSNSTVAISANKSVTITSSGSVIIGNGTRPFTIGAVTNRAYIYVGFDSMTPRTSAGTAIPFGTGVKGIYLGSDGINLANKFTVTDEGILKLKGTIYTDDGEIGGWTISTDGLYSGTTDETSVGLTSSDEIRIWAGKLKANKDKAPFYVKQDGTIHSVKGEIGGWKIEANALYADDKTVGLTSATDYRIFAGSSTQSNAAFYVKKDGTLKSTKGSIGGWAITENLLSANSKAVGMGTLGTIRFFAGEATFKKDSSGKDTQEVTDAKFYVKSDGSLKATKGTIGGWYIGSNYLGNAALIADSSVGLCTATDAGQYVFWAGSKTIAESPFYVTAEGYMKATSATVGGWSVNATQIYYPDSSGNAVVALDASGDYRIWAGTDTNTQFRIKADGSIRAAKGTIGGWSIGTTTLKSASGKTGLASTSNDTDVAFWAGTTGGTAAADSGNFYVKQNGYLYAADAYFKGEIQADTGSIGGWSIYDGWLKGGTAGMGSKATNLYAFWAGTVDASDSSNFYVKHDGELHAINANLKGMLKATSLYVGATDSTDGTAIKADNSGFVVSTAISDVGTTIKTTAGIKIDKGGVVISSETQDAGAAIKTTAGIKVDATTGIVISTSSSESDNVNKVAAINLDNNGKITISSTDVGQSTSAICVTTTGITAKTNGDIKLDGGTFTVTSGMFSIDKDGNVAIGGTVYASGGKIGAIFNGRAWEGGWNISNYQLDGGSATGYVGLNCDDTISGSDYYQPYAFWCGNPTAKDAPFKVRRDGGVYINSLKVNDGGTWKDVDLSGNFSNAVRLESSGSWSGNTFTATVNLFGKINKTITFGATTSITGISVDSSMYNDQYAVLNISFKNTVNGSTSEEKYTTFNQVYVRQIATLGWKLASDSSHLSYTSGAKSVTIPNSSSYGNTTSLDISATFDAGVTEGESHFEKHGDITPIGSKAPFTYEGYKELYSASTKDGVTTYTSVGKHYWYYWNSGGSVVYYDKGTDVTGLYTKK